MDKIKQLLQKTGVKVELAEKICESLSDYKTTIREQFEKEYAAKVEQAKTVCIEETETHKRELARRVQIFCETKGAAIEAQLAKQSALNESEALTTLNQVAAMLQGLEPNGGPSSDVTAVVKKLKHKAQLATEERKKAVDLANRQGAIAEKALKRNRQLSAALESAKTSARPVTEGRKRSGKKQSRRIDQSRKGGRTRSTRATLTESQDRRPVPTNNGKPNVAIIEAKSGFGIEDIAAQTDELV